MRKGGFREMGSDELSVLDNEEKEEEEQVGKGREEMSRVAFS